jgi:hypothetical protein
MDLVQNSIVFSLIKKEGTRNKKRKGNKGRHNSN